MKKIMFALVFVFLSSNSVFGALIVRGIDNSGNQLIYDDALNVTWYDLSVPNLTWQEALDWASNLTVTIEQNIYDDWRLTTALAPDGSGPVSSEGQAEQMGEIGRLNVIELGNVRYPNTGYNVVNNGPFTNIPPVNPHTLYWTSTPYIAGGQYGAWIFDWEQGHQGITDASRSESYIYSFAVRDGDIGQQAIPQTERNALIALYISTDGDNWTINDGWKTPPLHTDGFSMPGTECDWHGVTCSSDTVTTLRLDDNQLSGTIPDEIGNLTNLTALGLEINQLTGGIPSEIGNLTNLSGLILYHNQLTGTIPSEIFNLINLSSLIIGDNQLTGTIPPEISNLTNLIWLWLEKNQFSGTIPSEIGSLTNLHELSLGNNQLTGDIPNELDNLLSLRLLFLYGNRLSGDIPSSLVDLTSLQNVDIGYNALSTSDDTLRSFLTNLDPDWESTQTIAPYFTVTDATNSSISISWSPIAYTSDTGGYDIYYGLVSGDRTYAGSTPDKSASNFTITGLNPGTAYYVSIQTRTEPHTYNQNTVYSKFREILTGGTDSDFPNIVITPAATIDFGDLLLSVPPASRTVTISNTGNVDLIVSEITITNIYNFSYDTGSCGSSHPTIPPGSSCTFNTYFQPSLVGPLGAILSINSNDPDMPSVAVQLTGTGISDIDPYFNNASLPGSVNIPTSVNFSGTVQDDIALDHITMSVNGPAGTHTVFSESISGTSLSLSSYYFNSADPTYANIPGSYTVTLTATDSIGQSTSIEFQIQVTESLEPNISVVPTSVGFGNVIVGNSSSSFSVSVTNTGNVDLIVSDILLSDQNNYTLSTADCGMANPTIAAGSNCSVQVVFNPNESGTRNATLAITSNDPDTPSVAVQLTGTGISDIDPYFNNASLPGSVNIPTSVNFSGTVQDDNALDHITMSVNGPAGTHTVFSESISGTSLSLSSYYFNSADPTYANIPGSYTVTLTATDSIGQSTSIEFQIQVNKSLEPNISVAPTSVSFGNVIVGNSSSSFSVTVTNSGNVDLIVSNIVLSDQDNFALNIASCGITNPTIVAGNTCSVDVFFNPMTSGVHSATLTIFSNDPDAPSIGVQLTGTGIVGSAPNFDSASLPDHVILPDYVHFSGLARDDIGLSQIHMSVSGPAGTYDVFSRSISGKSHNLTHYYFNSADANYANIIGSYSITLTITDSEGQTTSEAFSITISDQNCEKTEISASSGSVKVYDPDLELNPNVSHLYKYGPAIILNGSTVDMWTSAPDPSNPWDRIEHRRGKINTEGAIAWTTAWTSALEATQNSRDMYSVCDPSVFSYNGFYYIGYTSTDQEENNGAISNDVFVARFSGLPDGNTGITSEKWNGSGWGGTPQPIIEYNGPQWGKGQPSFVVNNNILYIYYTDEGTKVLTVDVTNEYWPALIDETQAHVIFDNDRARELFGGKPGPFEVKYVDGLDKFFGIAISNEFDQEVEVDNYVFACESIDGIIFNPIVTSRDYWEMLILGDGGPGGAHNIGMSGDSHGHLDSSNLNNFISYGYGLHSEIEDQQGFKARWPTYLNKIEIHSFDDCIPTDDVDGGSGGSGGGGCFISSAF